MTDREALEAIQRIVDKAMPPDSGASVSSLLGAVSDVLVKVGLDRWEPSTEVQKTYPARWRGH